MRELNINTLKSCGNRMMGCSYSFIYSAKDADRNQSRGGIDGPGFKISRCSTLDG